MRFKIGRNAMINVIASILVKQESLPTFLEIFKSNVPIVKQEKGCIEYFPAVDVNAGLPPQILDEDMVTVIEKWENLDALHAHLTSTHMIEYQEKVHDMVEGISLKVLKEA